jgi:ribonuclease HI
MTFGFTQTDHHSEQRSFFASIENWPSSTRAELAAILSALLVVPMTCQVTIITDCLSVIEHYNEFSSLPNISPRYIFKEANNILWICLREIISLMNLKVSFHKIKAHSGNYSHDQVDSMVKSAHHDNNLLTLSLNFHSFDTISALPRWQGLPIECHLRHFISNLSRNTGFESWLSLYRNFKYHEVPIDWEATFFALSSDESSAETSFTASSKKKSKLKFLIEEIPTVEHIKKRRPDLYNDWMCPRCSTSKETFDHVWTCSHSRDHLIALAFELRSFLLDLITEYCPPRRSSSIPLLNINIGSLWTVVSDHHTFTFIVFIKGIIPLSLSKRLDGLFLNRSTTLTVLSKFLDKVHSTVKNEIWLPRCERQIDLEISHNITSRSKRKRNMSNVSYNQSVACNSSYNLDYNNRPLLAYIRHNCSWLDFTSFVNRFCFSGFNFSGMFRGLFCFVL